MQLLRTLLVSALLPLAPAAHAQGGFDGAGSASALSVAANPPHEIAQSIIIFVPSETTPGAIGDKDLFVKGRIVRVERGDTPGAIVRTAHSLTTSWAAGKPVRLMLMRHPMRDAYYPIFTDSLVPEEAALPVPYAADVTVEVLSPLGAPVHSAPLDGVPYAFTAHLQSSAGGEAQEVDLYLGITRPDQRGSFSWISRDDMPLLTQGMTPLASGITLAGSMSINTKALVPRALEYSFTGAERRGMYTVFALVVRAGMTPENQSNWLAADMKPLMVE